SVLSPDGVDPEDTARLVDRIALAELGDLAGVREAQLVGAQGDRVTIAPNQDTLQNEYLTQQSIIDALQQSGVLMAAGSITEDGQTLAVQAGSTLESVEEIRALPLVRDANLLRARAEAAAAEAQAEAAAAAEMPGFAAAGAATAAGQEP